MNSGNISSAPQALPDLMQEIASISSSIVKGEEKVGLGSEFFRLLFKLALMHRICSGGMDDFVIMSIREATASGVSVGVVVK